MSAPIEEQYKLVTNFGIINPSYWIAISQKKNIPVLRKRFCKCSHCVSPDVRDEIAADNESNDHENRLQNWFHARNLRDTLFQV